MRYRHSQELLLGTVREINVQTPASQLESVFNWPLCARYRDL